MIQIVPAILDKTPEEFSDHVDQLKNSLGFQEGWVHIDFADGKFVENKTLDPESIKKYPLNLKKEAHLMVARPLSWITKLKEVGFDRVIFHFESEDSVSEVIKTIKNADMEVGIAVNPDTKIDELESIKNRVDQVLVMGIVPGFQGQPFIPATIDKIRDLKSKNWPIKISTDGAVRDDNAKGLVDAGVDQLVSGSFLLKGDIDEQVEKLWEAINT